MSYVGLAGTGSLVVLPRPEGAASTQLPQRAADGNVNLWWPNLGTLQEKPGIWQKILIFIRLLKQF